MKKFIIIVYLIFFGMMAVLPVFSINKANLESLQMYADRWGQIYQDLLKEKEKFQIYAEAEESDPRRIYYFALNKEMVKALYKKQYYEKCLAAGILETTLGETWTTVDNLKEIAAEDASALFEKYKKPILDILVGDFHKLFVREIQFYIRGHLRERLIRELDSTAGEVAPIEEYLYSQIIDPKGYPDFIQKTSSLLMNTLDEKVFQKVFSKVLTEFINCFTLKGLVTMGTKFVEKAAFVLSTAVNFTIDMAQVKILWDEAQPTINLVITDINDIKADQKVSTSAAWQIHLGNLKRRDQDGKAVEQGPSGKEVIAEKRSVDFTLEVEKESAPDPASGWTLETETVGDWREDSGYKDQQGRKQGIWTVRSLDPPGIEFMVTYVDGVEQGYWIQYFDQNLETGSGDGHVLAEGYKVGGKKDGKWFYYRNDPYFLTSVVFYDKDFESRRVTFNEEGIKTKDVVFEKGSDTGKRVVTEWLKDGRMWIKTIENNKYNGYSEMWSDSGCVAKGEYKNGKREGEWELLYTKTGVTGKGTYTAGKKTGIWHDYYDTGELYAEVPFNSQGKLDGEQVVYHKSGAVKMNSSWKDGKRHGILTGWYENGVKAVEVVFEDGEEIRKICYDEKGKEKPCE